MSSTTRHAVVVATVFAAVGAMAAPAAATAHESVTTVTSAELVRGLYQSSFSQRNKVLWVTAAVGRPPVTDSKLLKVDPKTLAVESVITPPVVDETTGAVEAVYGVAADDEYNRVWVTNTRNNTVAVYSQKTGEHLATFPDVPHAREIVVDEKHNTVWASAFGSATLVAYDSKNLVEKKRVTVEGTSPAGLAVNDKTGTLYATDLAGDQLIEVSPASETPRLIPVGDGPISVDLSEDGKTAYTADQTAGAVSVVDLTDGTVTSVATGAGALSVAYEERSEKLLVVNRGAATVTVVDPEAGVVTETVPTATNPNHLTVANGNAYVVDKSGTGATGGDVLYRIHPAR